jgi:hypothetical protein
MRATFLLFLALAACPAIDTRTGLDAAGGGDAGLSPTDDGGAGQDAASHPSDASASGRDAAAVGADDAAAGTDAAPRTFDGGFPRPDPSIVANAVSTGLSSYHRNAKTGDIWCTPCDGAPVMLAAAAYAGDTSVDARLLQQMRLLLSGANDPFCTGGYSANDERNATAMYAIAKLTPRIWSQLTTAEVKKIDLVMEAALVADLYLTADKTNGSGPPVSFMGDKNFNRDWNPNYREGMIGAVLVGTEYFDGQQATEALLAGYDHAAFTADLKANGLDNAYWTFSTYQTNPASGAPSPQTVQQGIADYRLYGLTLGQLLDIYLNLANDTFSEVVTCGLNDGAGILVGGLQAGTIVAGCDALPNKGATGMEKEFNSVDAEGQRSSAGYVRLGTRANLFNHLVLLVYGDWQDTAASTAALDKVQVGVTDFFYKATQGYESYSHAKDEGLFKCPADMDCALNQALWTQIIAKTHGR